MGGLIPRRHQAAAGMRFVAQGEIQDGRIAGGWGDLAGVLCGRGQVGEAAEGAHAFGKPSAFLFGGGGAGRVGCVCRLGFHQHVGKLGA